MTAKRILIVEDNPIFRRGLERLLTAEGYEPHAFASAEAAAETAQTGAYDIALLDIRLPGTPGDAFAIYLQNKLPTLKIIFMSG